MFWRIVICLSVGYIFGSIPNGYIVGKLHHVDVRNYGSGNVGTTNTMRTLGFKAGIITFLGDFLKAIIPLVVFRNFIFRSVAYNELLALYCGLGTMMGHNYSVWLKFHGGKGIAVTAGVMAAFDPIGIIVYLPSFALAVFFTKYVSVGSLLIVAEFVGFIAVTRHSDPYFIHMLIIGMIFMGSAIYRHKSNIKRLMDGTENKFTRNTLHGSKKANQ